MMNVGGLAATPWHQHITGELLGSDANSIAIDPVAPYTLYTVSRVGIFKTTNGGRRWFLAGLEGIRVATVSIDSKDSSIIYAGTFGRGIYKSSNGGQSWSASNEGLGNVAVQAIAIDGNDTAILYVGTSAAGVFKSVDAGATCSWVVPCTR
jgi:photosystem II stability/assembly factor-like uncharacterized protein